MIEYELLYLVAESKEIDLARIREEVKAIVEGEGGIYSSAEKLEKRKLAYAIKREIRGTYIAQRFTTPDKNDREASVEAGDPSIIGLINRKLTLYRDVLRFIVVRAEGLPSLTPEEGTSKVVAEVAKEAQAKKAAIEKKTVRKPKVEAVSEAMKAESVKETASAEKKEEKAPATEAELDKQLEEVLHI
ncbi:MAG: 30S ribosomal protein S6 [Candidatus Moranbacteria bacterium]|nr:30S ribosomal protein S6 [Candidatus Moranbacteria bacterium]